MPISALTGSELSALVKRVFEPGADDRALAVLIDLPDGQVPDNAAWRTRRELAAGWVREMNACRPAHGLDVQLFLYRNPRANNADLPDTVWPHEPSDLPTAAEDAQGGLSRSTRDVLAEHRLVLAPTEFSATAPLKILAPQLGFRAATMPGFSSDMVPALRLDYTEVNRRVHLLKDLLDRATAADLSFAVDGAPAWRLHLDLRHRSAHASGGLLPQPGTAGNLPSGEAYIVPYEGEHAGDPTASAGNLPIQLGDEVVVFDVRDNRAVGVISEGPASREQAELLTQEPAYGNLAELGLGVLGDFGIKPIGEVLLDEKLGLHIALGRSEHFGGQVGPDDFSRPEAVVHQDHVYIDELQPRVVVATADLTMDDGTTMELMRDGTYRIDFGQG